MSEDIRLIHALDNNNNNVIHKIRNARDGRRLIASACHSLTRRRERRNAPRGIAGGARLPPTSQTTVVFCRTLVVAHCAPTPMTCGSCSCREHITKSVTGVSRPPVLDCGTTFHPDYCDRDFFDPFRQSMKTHLFGDRSA